MQNEESPYFSMESFSSPHYHHYHSQTTILLREVEVCRRDQLAEAWKKQFDYEEKIIAIGIQQHTEELNIQ